MANKEYHNDNIQKIIDNSDIVDVIGRYIHLDKKGNDYKGICPFHNDSNPSLSVSPSKKVFKCFSCNTAGNVIQFVQMYEKISFVEAMKKVASISGIDINIRENPQAARNRKYYKIMEDACRAYEFYLNETKEGEKALDYLAKRNINLDVIKRFRIGLASHSADLIVKTQIEEKKVLPLDLIELQLVRQREDKSYYDFFNGRIMFPLKDLEGNIVGFSGRIYDSTSNAKYMNSNENVIFKKSNILYNYSEAINDITMNDRVIIFEGFMDVIAAYKAGVNYTLATMGTALTEEQVKIILKLTKNITLCYDGDGPGIEATKRAIRLFSKYGVIVKAVELPQGLDPDDYLNQFGKDATYDLLVNKNISSIDYLYNVEKNKLDLSDFNSVTSFEKNVFDLINYFKSKALKNYIFDLMSKDLKMSISDIESEYSSLGSTGKKNNDSLEVVDLEPPVEIGDDYPVGDYPPVEYGNDIDDVPYTESNQVNVHFYEKRGYYQAEEGIIFLSLNSGDDCKTIRRKLGFGEFVDAINRDLLNKLGDYYSEHKKFDFDAFIKDMRLSDEEIKRLDMIRNTTDIYKKESIDDYISKVKQAKYDRAANDIRKEFASGNGKTEDIERLIECKKKTIKIRERKK